MTPVLQSYVVPSWGEYGVAAVKVVLFAVFLAALWELLNALTKFNDEEELFTRRNIPYAIERIAIVLAQAIAMMPLLAIRTEASWSDVGSMAAWSVSVLVLLLVVTLVADRLLGTAVHDQSSPAVLASAQLKVGFYLAFGLIVNAALSGSAADVGTGILATVVFVALGLVGMVLAYWLLGLLGPFRRRSSQDVAAGSAASIVSAGVLISLGLVLRTAIAGDFTTWGPALTGFLFTFYTGFVGLVAVLWLIDLLIIRSRRLSGIVRDNEVLPAIVMAAMLVAVAFGVSAVVV